MNKPFEFAKKCQCGAVTVEIDGESYSMKDKTFRTLFPGSRVEPGKYINCNHCVNNWGVDLCACGSGEPYQTCDAGYPECGTPFQTIGEIKECVLWKFH